MLVVRNWLFENLTTSGLPLLPGESSDFVFCNDGPDLKIFFCHALC